MTTTPTQVCVLLTPCILQSKQDKLLRKVKELLCLLIAALSMISVPPQLRFAILCTSICIASLKRFQEISHYDQLSINNLFKNCKQTFCVQEFPPVSFTTLDGKFRELQRTCGVDQLLIHCPNVLQSWWLSFCVWTASTCKQAYSKRLRNDEPDNDYFLAKRAKEMKPFRESAFQDVDQNIK